jgi:chromosome segregation protein
LQMENQKALMNLGDPDATYKALRAKWGASHLQKLELLDAQCQKFSLLSNGLIKAEIVKSIDIVQVKAKLKSSFVGMNIKDQKIDHLCQQIQNAAKPLDAWNALLAELELLALHQSGGVNPIPATAMLSASNFIETERARIAASFNSEKWLGLSTLELEFSPEFYYSTNKATNEYINFADASAGQQATALLTVLLNQEGAPLIIDQPEDDVDSKLVKDIIAQIWKAKSKRQLIFASHNANFVVNGDSELVVCCDYVKAGDQTGGQIKCAGAIDNETIKEEITTVTEGGKLAFKLRMDKYGF